MVQEKWVALSNTTLGILMASINGTIVLISLPAIFRGININPFAGNSFVYLLWILMGYNIVTATLLVTFGRLSDIFGRVRLFNLGFAIFTAGSILLFLTPGTGDTGAMELILFRVIQGVGASFLFSNSAAIITDAFPYNERGKAMGINSIAGLSGSFIGLILGGVLSLINWRLIFLVSVPIGVLGTIWSYWKLKETSPKLAQKIDYAGNITFGAGLVIALIGVTYGLIPYNGSSMGWSDPWVIIAIVVGLALLVAFLFIERVVKFPMFKMELFKIRRFSMGSLSGLFSSVAMGGVMFMIVLLLQGIWLPIHGYSYASAPFWAGIFMLPMTAGFMVMGPIAGIISDRRGPTKIATFGFGITAFSFVLMYMLTANFYYPFLGITLFVFGLGMGMFAAPNTSSLMNSVPPDARGAASGMATTLRNSGQTASMAIFFTILIYSMSTTLPASISAGLTSAGAPQLIPFMANVPPTDAIFAAFLGINPSTAMLSLLTPAQISALSLSPTAILNMSANSWFPGIISSPFMTALHLTFIFGFSISVVGVILSALRGKDLNATSKPVRKEPGVTQEPINE
ncbi:MAG: MFS transporter [Candidatus Thermoplasmatota archaeon]|nr:MFS transporter [Candidatus Thermoplasmatota archaeon]